MCGTRESTAMRRRRLAALFPRLSSEAAHRLRKQLLEFVYEQAHQAREGEHLLGSSEVLESIIGKFKCVAGERGQHGLTGMVLSIGTLVGQVTVGAVPAAMTEVRVEEVRQWCRTHLGPTLQGARRQIALAFDAEQKRTQLAFGKT